MCHLVPGALRMAALKAIKIFNMSILVNCLYLTSVPQICENIKPAFKETDVILSTFLSTLQTHSHPAVVMGILGLSKLVADAAPAAIKENEIKNYFGR